MFIKLTNGVPEKYTIGQLRKNNPNVSFPKDIPNNVLADYDVYPLYPAPVPNYDDLTHTCKEVTPLQNEKGDWVETYIVEQREQSDAEERVRKFRNELLTITDWTQIADAPVNQLTWATYRQALRDLPSQIGFPFNVTFPTKPE